jgi:hypothetical protein
MGMFTSMDHLAYEQEQKFPRSSSRSLSSKSRVLLRRSIAQPCEPVRSILLFDHFAFNNPIEGPIRGFPMHHSWDRNGHL